MTRPLRRHLSSLSLYVGQRCPYKFAIHCDFLPPSVKTECTPFPVRHIPAPLSMMGILYLLSQATAFEERSENFNP
jgi:hypothetical protein